MKDATTNPRARDGHPKRHPLNCCLASVRNQTAKWTDGPNPGTSTVTCPVCGYSWTETVAAIYEALSPIDPRD